MQRGALVRYVDQNNEVQLGLLTAAATREDAATIVPLASVLTLSSLILDPLTIGLSHSQYVAGGPPYWLCEPE